MDRPATLATPERPRYLMLLSLAAPRKGIEERHHKNLGRRRGHAQEAQNLLNPQVPTHRQAASKYCCCSKMQSHTAPDSASSACLLPAPQPPMKYVGMGAFFSPVM